ncbi:MAG TPA: hypothetical protein PKN33_04490 [Phycisphaerae bacterium]|nr:hypothetical protein [Phycisphaerae bacterium]
MSKKVRKAIETLQELSPKLNDTTSAANDTVAKVEAFLNDQCSIGLPCWILAERIGSKEAPSEQHVWLGYDRVDGKFRVVVEQLIRHEDQEEHTGPKPWASCSRDLKLNTLPKLPKLLEAIAEEACKMAEKNDTAISAIETILTAMSDEKDSEAKGGDKDKKKLKISAEQPKEEETANAT